MTTSLMKDVEVQLSSDADGTYKTQLLELLRKNKEDFTSKKQGFLSPEDYNQIEQLEKAATAAISVVENYMNEDDESKEPAKENVSSFNSIINV